MTISASIRQSSSLGGVSFPESRTITADGQIVHEVSVPAAQGSELAGKVSSTAGNLTMDESDHTITTGARLNLYWSGGRRWLQTPTASGSSGTRWPHLPSAPLGPARQRAGGP